MGKLNVELWVKGNILSKPTTTVDVEDINPYQPVPIVNSTNGTKVWVEGETWGQ